jgi:hypothetical protein
MENETNDLSKYNSVLEAVMDQVDGVTEEQALSVLTRLEGAWFNDVMIDVLNFKK